MKLGNVLTTLAVASVAAISFGQGKQMHKPVMAKPMMAMKSKADWQKDYNQAEKMFDAKNADAIFGYMAPDFTMTMGGKTYNAAQAKASMKQWFGMMKDLHCTMTVTNVANKGGMTVVTDKFNNTGHTMPDPKTKKSGMLRDWGTEEITWMNHGGKWMIHKIVTHDEKMTMNGKPFKPSM